MTTESAQPVANRQCDNCAMCCKLPQITDLEKPANQWCPHCRNHQNCGNYEQRPQMCRDFFCLFMTQEALSEEWRPSQAHFLMLMKETSLDRPQLVVMVDPARPDAWRKEPYYSNLRNWSQTHYVIITIGDRWRALFPDHEVDLQKVGPRDELQFIDALTEHGPKRTVQLKRAD